jgi:hypothetical protein
MSGMIRTALIELMLTMWPELRRQDAACHAHQADQVGLDDAGPIVCRPDIEAGPAADVMSGVVDEDVDRLESIRNMIGQAVHAFGVGNIELDRERAVAHFGGELTKGFRGAVDQYDPASAFQQRLGDGAAHAAQPHRSPQRFAPMFQPLDISVADRWFALMRWTSLHRSAGSHP